MVVGRHCSLFTFSFSAINDGLVERIKMRASNGCLCGGDTGKLRYPPFELNPLTKSASWGPLGLDSANPNLVER